MNISELSQLNTYIESEIAPSIISHGGNIQIRALNENTLTLELNGACVLCPADKMTKQGIELQLKSKFAFLKEVKFESVIEKPAPLKLKI